MIIVDVFVPSLDHTYNLNIDEETKIGILIEEMSELICKKNHSDLSGEIGRFALGSVDKKICFDPKKTLQNYSIKNGEKLILV